MERLLQKGGGENSKVHFTVQGIKFYIFEKGKG